MHLLNLQPHTRICFSTRDSLIARKRRWIASCVAIIAVVRELNTLRPLLMRVFTTS